MCKEARTNDFVLSVRSRGPRTIFYVGSFSGSVRVTVKGELETVEAEGLVTVEDCVDVPAATVRPLGFDEGAGTYVFEMVCPVCGKAVKGFLGDLYDHLKTEHKVSSVYFVPEG